MINATDALEKGKKEDLLLWRDMCDVSTVCACPGTVWVSGQNTLATVVMETAVCYWQLHNTRV